MDEILEKDYWETVQNAGEVKRQASHQVVNFFSIQRIKYLTKYLDIKSISTALDVGSGTSFSSYYFPKPINLTSLDFSLRNLKLNPMKNKIQASAFKLPFSNNSFDLVYGWDFLHHLDNPTNAVFEMARVTKKYIVLFEPNRNNPIQFIYALLNKNERGTLKFNKKKLIELMNQINFKLITCETVGWIFAGASPTFSLNLCKHFSIFS